MPAPDRLTDEKRYRFLDRLGQATRALTDANAVMETTARLLGQALGATRCAYADVEADGDRFTIRNDWSMPGVPSSVGVCGCGRRTSSTARSARWPGSSTTCSTSRASTAASSSCSGNRFSCAC